MRNPLRLSVGATALALLATFIGGPAAAAAHAGASAPPGALLTDRSVARLSTAAVRAELAQARIGPGAPALGAGAVRHGLVAYRVTYRTTDATGRTVRASGIVAFPDGGARRLRIVEYEHGTTADRHDVPSSFGTDAAGDGIEGRWSTELFASAGFAVAEPDYVGMGNGSGRPEYMVVRSEVSASVDLLRAAAQLAARHGDRLDPSVLVTGFSQGGAAALALGRALEQRAAPGFGLAALAPVSGPYDLMDTEVPAALSGRIDPGMAAYLIAYTLTAWNPIYHLYSDPGRAFEPPYASQVEELFDGSHSDRQIAGSLPPSVKALLTPLLLRRLRHPRGALRRALIANSTCTDSIPRAPLRFYAAKGDRTVTELNTRHCRQALSRHGHRVPLVELGPVDHDISDFVALPRIVRWFARWNER